MPVQAGGLVLGRFGEQKRRYVDPTVTVNHEGMQVAAVLAHDPPAPLLVSRRHVLLKVSDDEANLTVENISTTQFVLVKHRGAAHGGGGGKRYELLQTGDKTAVQWGTRLWLGYKNDKLAADPESDAYNNMTWDVMQTKSGKGSNDKKGGKSSKRGGKGSGQRASHAVKAAAAAAAASLTAAVTSGDPATLQAAIIKATQQLGKAEAKNKTTLTHEDRKKLRKKSFRPNPKPGRGRAGGRGGRGGGQWGRGGGGSSGRGGGGSSKKGASRSGAGARRS